MTLCRSSLPILSASNLLFFLYCCTQERRYDDGQYAGDQGQEYDPQQHYDANVQYEQEVTYGDGDGGGRGGDNNHSLASASASASASSDDL